VKLEWEEGPEPSEDGHSRKVVRVSPEPEIALPEGRQEILLLSNNQHIGMAN